MTICRVGIYKGGEREGGLSLRAHNVYLVPVDFSHFGSARKGLDKVLVFEVAHVYVVIYDFISIHVQNTYWDIMYMCTYITLIFSFIYLPPFKFILISMFTV